MGLGATEKIEGPLLLSFHYYYYYLLYLIPFFLQTL